MELIILGIVAIAIVGAAFLRRRRTAKAARIRQASMDTRFHAVSIHYAEGACSAAKALSGQRYLADDAPQLPLAGCDASRCRCRFTHYEDRRSAGERRSPFGGPNYGDDSRSKLQERRSGDKRRRDADRGPE